MSAADGRARVVVADPDHLFAEALAMRLDAEADLVAQAAPPDLSCIARVASGGAVDVVVADAGLPVAQVVRAIGADGAGPPHVVVLSTRPSASAVLRALQAGAAGFVPKDSSTDVLLAAVRGVCRGEAHVPPDLLAAVVRRLRDVPGLADLDEPLSKLTPRQLELLQLLVAGLDRQTVARRLGVSPNTVRTHVRGILAKLEVHSTLEAVALALGTSAGAERAGQAAGERR